MMPIIFTRRIEKNTMILISLLTIFLIHFLDLTKNYMSNVLKNSILFQGFSALLLKETNKQDTIFQEVQFQS